MSVSPSILQQPPHWAELMVRWLLRVAAARSRAGTLRNVFIAQTPGNDLVLVSWLANEQGVVIAACYRPRLDHLAKSFVDHANGEVTALAPWEEICDSSLVARIVPSGSIDYEACVAKPDASRDLPWCLPRCAIDPDPVEMIRLFRDAADKQDQERWAA